MRPAALGLLVAVLAWGCVPATVPEREELEAPEEVRGAALEEAARYIGMEYEWGGDDVMPRGIDCSGLVVNVYRYAAELYGFELPFEDATASGLMESYTVAIEMPEAGDLLFMGSADSATVTHVALFERSDEAGMHFIDATLIPDLGIDGVSRRSYPAGDPRFKAFGRLVLYRWRER